MSPSSSDEADPGSRSELWLPWGDGQGLCSAEQHRDGWAGDESVLEHSVCCAATAECNKLTDVADERTLCEQ